MDRQLLLFFPPAFTLSTLHISNFTLHISHSSLYISNFTLHIPHFTLHIPQNDKNKGQCDK